MPSGRSRKCVRDLDVIAIPGQLLCWCHSREPEDGLVTYRMSLPSFLWHVLAMLLVFLSSLDTRLRDSVSGFDVLRTTVKSRILTHKRTSSRSHQRSRSPLV